MKKTQLLKNVFQKNVFHKKVFLTERAYDSLVDWLATQGLGTVVTITDSGQRSVSNLSRTVPACPNIQRMDMPVESPFYKLGIKHRWVQKDWTSCAACAVNNLFQTEAVGACVKALNRKDLEREVKAAMPEFGIRMVDKKGVQRELQESSLIGFLLALSFPGNVSLHWMALVKKERKWVLLDSIEEPRMIHDVEKWLQDRATLQWPILAVIQEENDRRELAKLRIFMAGVKSKEARQGQTTHRSKSPRAATQLQEQSPKKENRGSSSAGPEGLFADAAALQNASLMEYFWQHPSATREEAPNSQAEDEQAQPEFDELELQRAKFGERPTTPRSKSPRAEAHSQEPSPKKGNRGSSSAAAALQEASSRGATREDALNSQGEDEQEQLKLDELLQRAKLSERKETQPGLKAPTTHGSKSPIAEAQPQEPSAGPEGVSEKFAKLAAFQEAAARDYLLKNPGATKEDALKALFDSQRPEKKEEALKPEEVAKPEAKPEAKALRTNVAIVKCREEDDDKKCVLKVFLKESDAQSDKRILSILDYFSKLQLTPKLKEGGNFKNHLVLLMERFQPFNLYVRETSDIIAAFHKLFALILRVARHGWFLGDIKLDNFVIDTEANKVLVIDIEPGHTSSFEKDNALVKQMRYKDHNSKEIALTLTYGATMLYLLYRMLERFGRPQDKYLEVLREINKELKLYAFTLPEYEAVSKSSFWRAWCPLLRHYLQGDEQKSSCSRFWADLHKKISYSTGEPQYRALHPPFRKFVDIDETKQPPGLSEATKRLVEKTLRGEHRDVRSRPE